MSWKKAKKFESYKHDLTVSIIRASVSLRVVFLETLSCPSFETLPS